MTTETGAETQTATAELQGDQTTATETTGADTQSQHADDGVAEDVNSQESTQEVDTEGQRKERGKHQTTLEERVSQLAEKRFAEMQAKFEDTMQKKQAEHQKPFVVVDMEKLNAHFTSLKDSIADAELKGDIVTALELEDQMRELRASLKENEKKRSEWESSQTKEQQRQQQERLRIQRIDESAEFYREQKGIPRETWDAAGKWLTEQFKADPVLGRQFMELIERQGEIAAFKWADEFCQQNMGAKAKADKESKEAGKSAMVAGTAATSATSVKSFAELMQRPGAEIVKFQREHPEEFQKLKESHFK